MLDIDGSLLEGVIIQFIYLYALFYFYSFSRVSSKYSFNSFSCIDIVYFKFCCYHLGWSNPSNRNRIECINQTTCTNL